MARAAHQAGRKKTAAKKKAPRTVARQKSSNVRGKLAVYNRKRDFTKTPEPGPERKSSPAGNSYLIQKHDARRLHYDFRLELDGVLLSWAIPKGPSLDPADKRLAVRTEDHPLEYGKFEGVIPEGEYGGGTVMLWDRGTWSWTKDPHKWLKRGQLEFELHGERLKGNWVLTRMKPRPGEKEGKENWLLIKRRDDVARDGDGEILVDHELTSVASERSMNEIAAEKNRVWSSKDGGEQKTPKQKRSKETHAKPVKITGGTKARLPDFIAPQLATLVAQAPDGERWLHEIKFDGYRTEARIEDGEVQMLTRTGLDWTKKFAPIAAAVADLPVTSALIDGEIVVSNKGGVTNFGDLQKALSEGEVDRLSYYVFDLLHLDGKDLRKLALIERKEILRKLLPEGDGGLLHYSDHFTDRGPDFYRHACRLDLEGIVSKRTDASYTSGRGKSWLKTKCTKRQEFVIGGWVASTKAGRDLRSLLVGYYDGPTFRYAGKIGTGFNARNTAQLLALFKKNATDESSFESLPKGIARGVHWVKPKIVIEAEFATWTHDRVIRHSSLEGIREDKEAKDVVLEMPIDAPSDPNAVAAEPQGNRQTKSSAKSSAKPQSRFRSRSQSKSKGNAAQYGGITLTHPDRVLWADTGTTKRQLADYYAIVAPLMLPHIVNRPLSLVRCPDGADAKCFFQRHMGQGLPDAVEGVKVRGDKNPYLAIRDETGLFALIQFSTLEIHPWGASADDPNRPDRIIMDFDPGEAVEWNSVKAAALECHQRLTDMGLTSFLKTTGGKGLHVVVPIGRHHDWSEVKDFAQALATTMAADNRIYITRATKSARHGRIFIDYLRNDRTATAIAPYSTRARAGAPIAMPLDWSEIRSLPAGNHYTLRTIEKRLNSKHTDPWADMARVKQRLTAKAKKAVGLA